MIETIDKALEMLAIGGKAYKASHPDAGKWEIDSIKWTIRLAFLSVHNGRPLSSIGKEEAANVLRNMKAGLAPRKGSAPITNP